MQDPAGCWLGWAAVLPGTCMWASLEALPCASCQAAGTQLTARAHPLLATHAVSCPFMSPPGLLLCRRAPTLAAQPSHPPAAALFRLPHLPPLCFLSPRFLASQLRHLPCPRNQV